MSLPDVAVSRIGGDVAVDFFNTADWRLDPDRFYERLPTYLHLLAWAQRCELLTAEEVDALVPQARQHPDLAATEHRLVLQMREDTYQALTEGGEPEVLQRHLSEAHAHSRLTRTRDRRWVWTPASLELATPRHRLALELARLLTSQVVVNFHRCEDRYCGWVFLDTSRRRNRRWCSSAGCGNRNRVRAHHQRSKRAATRGSTRGGT